MLYARHAVYPARRVVRLNAHATRAGAGAHGARPRGAPGGPGPGLIFLIARRLAPHPAPAGREMPKSHTDNYKDSKKSPGTFLHAPGGSRPARHAWQARSGTAKVNRTPRDRTAQLSGAERTAGTRARRYHAAAAARTATPREVHLYMPSMCVAQASEVSEASARPTAESGSNIHTGLPHRSCRPTQAHARSGLAALSWLISRGRLLG